MNTEYIMAAMEYYRSKGYYPYSVPHVVKPNISDVTKPEGSVDKYHLGKVYVASAEQSFLQLISEGYVPQLPIMAITPCFRHEPVIDDLHYEIFLKLELFILGSNNVGKVINDAHNFFRMFSTKVALAAKETPNENIETDILVNGIEVGSYGTRHYKGHDYVYGTGIAEPRLSYALDPEGRYGL